MEFTEYPNTDNPYTGMLYTASTSIFDSQNPSAFNPRETFPDMEGGIYREQLFDELDEARAAYNEQIEKAIAESSDSGAYSYPYDTISVILASREYEDGLWMRNLRNETFESTIIDHYDIKL